MEKSKLSEIEKDKTGEEQSQEHLIVFFGTKEIALQELVLADQRVNSAYYCDVLRQLRENVPRFGTEIW
jgi:hypothetical protein